MNTVATNKIVVQHYDAFSRIPNMGNPAGVVINASALDDDAMQSIAVKVGFNETAYVLPSDVADLRLRYFTPGHEIDLCGHATVGTLAALAEHGAVAFGKQLTVETRAGILPMRVTQDDGGIRVTMRQAAPQFLPFDGDRQALAAALGLEVSDFDEDKPITYGSTGTWTLLVPIKRLASFARMTPRTAEFPEILTSMPRASLHPICWETYDPSADMHARHFSSPFSGTVEDAVTGTASGVMGAYLVTYLGSGNTDDRRELIVEQGQEIGRDGRVFVSVARDGATWDVSIAGNAVRCGEMMVTY